MTNVKVRTSNRHESVGATCSTNTQYSYTLGLHADTFKQLLANDDRSFSPSSEQVVIK